MVFKCLCDIIAIVFNNICDAVGDLYLHTGWRQRELKFRLQNTEFGLTFTKWRRPTQQNTDTFIV